MALFKNLTKKESEHLKSHGIKTLHNFTTIAAAQVETRKTSTIEPCYECKNIARKFSFEV